jgi:hypothetical protein
MNTKYQNKINFDALEHINKYINKYVTLLPYCLRGLLQG